MAKSAPSTPVPDPATAALAERVAQLEAENARLHAAATAPAVHQPRRHVPWRSIGSAVLIVIAAILVPVTVVAGWARAELVDEDTFVSTFAPLAADPAVQQAITVAAVAAIEEQVDFRGMTDAVFDGLGALDLPPAANSVLELLRVPAAEGLRSVLHTGVDGFVTSDLFAQVWTVALRTAHRAMLATVATPSADSAVIIDANGQIILQIGPIARQIGTYLSDHGFPFASAMLDVDASIVVAQSDALVLISTVHTITTAVGTWLPILTLVLLAAGILLARRRRVATAGAGIGVAIGAGAFLLAAAIGTAIAVGEIARAGVSGAAARAVIDQVLSGMRESAGDLLLIGVLVAVLALLTGSTRLRAAFAGMNARLATLIGVPAWRDAGWVRFLVGQRALVAAVLIVVPLLLVLLLPLGWVGIVLVVLVTVLVWWFVAVVRAGAGVPAVELAVEPAIEPAPAG